MNDSINEKKEDDIETSSLNEVLNKDDSANQKLVWFLVGLGLVCGGGFLVTQNTILTTKFSLLDILGINPPFGLVILPALIGFGVLFFNDRSILGWILFIGGLVTIILGIISGLTIHFMPVSLYQGLIMFGMISAGIGLIAKAIAKTK